MTSVSCLRDPLYDRIDGPAIDAETHAYGMCSLKCYRLRDCGLEDPADQTACENACVDEALETFSTDPCWAEWIELRRCIARENECSGVADEEPSPDAEAQCAGREEALDLCDA